MWPSTTSTRLHWAEMTMGARTILSPSKVAEDLAGLGLDLLLLALDEGDDVGDRVEGGDARVARAAQGLHAHDHRGLGAEGPVQGPEDARPGGRSCSWGW